jgi:hypothetical protein
MCPKVVILPIAIALLFSACAGVNQVMEKPAVNLTGIWQGEIRVIPCLTGISAREPGRCNAVNRITFSLRQTDSSLSGTYRCAIGTMVCRDANTTDHGTVMSGNVSGNNVTIRVMLPGDLSSCLYNGVADAPGSVRGSYRCYQGGGLAEVGQWRVGRGSIEPAPNPPPPWRPE